jgi:hypothetical protein
MIMSVDLDELLERVTDEQSFTEFVAALGADFSRERALEEATASSPYEAGASGWENGSVDTFLDAAAAWAVATSRNARRMRQCRMSGGGVRLFCWLASFMSERGTVHLL